MGEKEQMHREGEGQRPVTTWSRAQEVLQEKAKHGPHGVGNIWSHRGLAACPLMRGSGPTATPALSFWHRLWTLPLHSLEAAQAGLSCVETSKGRIS